MFCTWKEIKVQEARRIDLLKEAESYRLLKKVQADRLGLWGRLLLSLGDFLISSGHKLKARCQPKAASPLLRAGQRF